MLKKDALKIVGGLSRPSKMPCKGYSLPASACKIGQIMAKHEGTTCSDCYAMKGMYRFKNVQDALQRRLKAIDHPRWVGAMATLIKGMPYFRWHDSGDLQSVKHLYRIVSVCRMTPETKHWLPTRERKIVRQFINRFGDFPDNLVVRISDVMVDKPTTFQGIEIKSMMGDYTIDLPRSGVHTDSVRLQKSSHECPAYKQDGHCGECRACWDETIDHVSYLKH